jgi:hypothetical protein
VTIKLNASSLGIPGRVFVALRSSYLLPSLTVIAVALVIAVYMDALNNGLSGPDEPSHFLNSYLIWSYVHGALGQNPIAYAQEFYFHYPKISIGHWPPLYYALLSGIFFLLPHDPIFPFVVNILITIFPAVLIIGLMRQIAGPEWAFLGALWFVMVPINLEGISSLMLDHAVAVLALLGAITWSRYTERPRLLWALLYGAITGAAILVKGNGWLLGVFPLAHMTLSGRWRLLLKPATYAGALLALSLALPWYYFTYKISAEGFNYDWGLSFIALALRFYASALYANVGAFGLLAAVGGAVAAIVQREQSELRNIAILCVSLIVSTVVFHAIVPVALQDRYMAPTIPPLIMLGTIGISFAIRRFVQRAAKRVATLVALALLLVPGATFLSTTQGKIDLRMADVAESVLGAYEGRIIVIDGDSSAEGALAAEIAIREREPRTYVVRASMLLATSDFMGHRYELKGHSAEEVLDALEALGASVVVVASGEGVGKWPHSALLLKALEHPASPYHLAKVFPHENYQGTTLIYQLSKPLPVALDRLKMVNWPNKTPSFGTPGRRGSIRNTGPS